MYSSNKKTLYSTRSSVNWVFFGALMPKKSQFTHELVKLDKGINLQRLEVI
jgi:hypothetical protein